MASEDTVINVAFNDSVPPSGNYANGALVWHTVHEFTVDFVSHRSPIQHGHDHDVLVVARLRIPTSAMFPILQVMSANLDRYEREYGPIVWAAPDGPSE